MGIYKKVYDFAAKAGSLEGYVYPREGDGDRPIVHEIPVSEAWLFQNEEAFESVRKGIRDVSEQNISKLNLKDF